MPPAAEIVTIGDELNRGEIVDTNSTWLAERLTRLGFHVRWRTSTTDDEGDMAAALRTAAGRARVVLTSGGLGPTDDDRTVDVVSRLCDVAPVEEPAHRATMEARFAHRGFAVTPNNLRQVRVPSGATVLANAAGLAPGFAVRLGAADVMCMPGVPREMKRIFDDGAVALLEKIVGTSVRTALRAWRTIGLGESHVAHRLAGVLDGIADATLHYRIAYPETLVTIVVRRATDDEARAVLDRLDGEVRRRLGGAVYATDDTTLPIAVGERLAAAGQTLAVAESCTGGLIGDLVTDVAGSSRYFLGGVVAYSNDVKVALVGVRPETLAAHGAVSEATVREMAAGVRARFGATWGVAVSGIAGPTGGTPEKPVGTVHFAVAGPEGTQARVLRWAADRRQVKQLAAHAALNLLHKQLDPSRTDAPDSGPGAHKP